MPLLQPPLWATSCSTNLEADEGGQRLGHVNETWYSCPPFVIANPALSWGKQSIENTAVMDCFVAKLFALTIQSCVIARYSLSEID